MNARVALITGITGQDSALLAELLLAKGHIVHGAKRRSSSFNTGWVDHLYHDPHEADVRFFMHYGDLTDVTNLIWIVQEVQSTEIYNLAARSHVQMSFENPEYTANADALGTLRLLEAIPILGMKDWVRFYQASTSEMFGKVQEVPQRETTLFYPRSPYGTAKVYAHWITVSYREAYGFLYVDDLADALVFTKKHYSGESHLNELTSPLSDLGHEFRELANRNVSAGADEGADAARGRVPERVCLVRSQRFARRVNARRDSMIPAARGAGFFGANVLFQQL